MMSAADAPDNEAGRPGLFAATRWSVVRRARDESTGALQALFIQYRAPLIVFLVAKGTPRQDAEDLVQGFCAHLLRQEFLAEISVEKGRFRTFLLCSLLNFVRDAVARGRALKRGGGVVPRSLDEVDVDGRCTVAPAAVGNAADLEYDRAWARAVLDQALRRLGEECSRSGHVLLWRETEPVLFAEDTAASYREIGLRLGMSEGAVKVAVHRIRVRLRGLIREEVLETVASGAELEEELRYLTSLFGR